MIDIFNIEERPIQYLRAPKGQDKIAQGSALGKGTIVPQKKTPERVK